MEADFSERLKRYRKERNLTQQDLADQVGVSNKTVSRWESGGGYPDVPVLVPLARALGVTVDDLLDDEKPIRTLTQGDWQSLLSFAFALGGGVLYFLLDLFMPALVCYLAYLGCMAYGVYLQKHYAYRSRWFLLGNAVMNLCINVTILLRCALLLTMIPVTMTVDNTHDWGIRFLFWLGRHRPALSLMCILLAVVLTVLTQRLVVRRGFSATERPSAWSGLFYGEPHVELTRPRIALLLPAAVPFFACAFWLIYQQENLSLNFCTYQEELFLGVLLALAVLASLPLLKKGDRRWILPVWCMTALCWCMTGLRTYRVAWSPFSKRLIPYTKEMSDLYTPLGQWSWGMLVLAVVLSALWILLQCVRLRWETPETKQALTAGE